MTFGLLPSRRHVTWRDSVSVWVHCLGSKWEWVGILQQSFSVCCALLTSHKNGETVVYGYNPRSVLGSFGVVLMSCKVYFHVVRSALQNSVGLLRQCSSGPSLRGRRLGSFRRERNSRAAAREEGGEETTTLPRTGMFVWTANGRDTLIGGFESTRIPHMPLVEIFAPVMLRKLVSHFQDRFSREIFEGLSSHSDGAWIHI